MNPVTIFEKLNELDYTLVEFQLRQKGYKDEQIKRMKRECLRFLAISSVKNIPFLLTPIVDDFWHAMILHTKFYAEEVTPILGKFFHHLPNDGYSNGENRNLDDFWQKRFMKGIEAYEDTFGEPDLEIWGIERKTMNGGGVK